MERNIKRIGLVNLLVLLAIGVASTVLARSTNTLAGQSGIIFLGLGFLVIAISYFQIRLEESERLERLEFEEINKTAASASLFNTADAEVFPARRSREQFERFFVPGFTVVLLLLQVGGAYWVFDWLRKLVPTGVHQPTVAMSLFGLFALALFLIGKYSVGMARLDGARLLRAGANYLLLGAYVCFLITVCIASVQLGFPKVDLYVAYVFGGLLALVAAESLINLVLEIYRPRVAGKVGRLLYDSRLVGLLAEPEGLFTTAAHALDYQFGFKVSETWFYRFLEKALVWLILLQFGVLLASTCFVFISPGEQGLLERFGSAVGGGTVLEPGLHLKLPWPVDQVYRFSTLKIQNFNIGFVPEDEGAEKAVFWTGKHYKEESNWLVASRNIRSDGATNNSGEGGVPADLINVSVPVQFQIKDLRAWEYNHTDAPKLLERIATREVVRYLSGTDILQLMATGRSEAAEELKRRIQREADTLPGGALGVNVVLVGLQDLHPPVKVAPKFEEVVGTLQENEGKVYEANGYSNKTITLAKADATRMVRDALSYSNLTVSAAVAQSAQFYNQVQAYRASPQVYMERSYLQALERGTTNSRKYVLATTNTHDIIQMNLEEKIRGDLLNDLTIPAPK
jgi:regulator of protease activity HflC (stomatin/prohibitin superfamily)